MKKIIYLIIVLFSFILNAQKLPKNFVYLEDIVPSIRIELRYFSNNNFIGKPIDGYNSNSLIITEETAKSLKKIQQELLQKELSLKIFDGYRPQKAVDHFVRWVQVLKDTLMKAQFYPKVKKNNLLKNGYIAERSGHSRGSTIDLTIINTKTGKALDMGSAYDFFGIQSHPLYQNISKKQKNNRMLLRNTMLNHGFTPYENEWWHFTLKKEPFPNTYFTFPISKN
ncbi:M15 family metallopeptidase [uncultured Polaribacter sp.]|jgi:D-alanyl-D-alanine dipeptidase|uniref:M15 family metallopeptidase n=1 Tax=uncultured Polaribacter sp. TaxID=174711 RepID=UPI0030DA8F33